MKNKFSELEFFDLDSIEMDQTYGGVALLPYLGYWILVDMVANSRKSINAFKEGWNSF